MNVATIALTYEEIMDLIEELDGKCSAEELHGVAAGQIAVGANNSSEDWLKMAVEFIDAVEPMTAVIKLELCGIYDNLVAALQDTDLSFQLLLPDDDSSVEFRATALGKWCQGFLVGFGTSGMKRHQLSEELEEALHDIAAISQVGSEEDDSEESEQNFVTLTEYVRMAVLNIYLEMAQNNRQAGKHSAQDPGTHQLH